MNFIHLKGFRISIFALVFSLLVQGCTNEPAKAPEQNTETSQDASETITESSVITKQARFITEDSEEISGLVYGQGDIGIVLAHMRGRGKSFWIYLAANARDSGYVVLAFDFRGYGDSTGEKDKRMDRDLEAAVRYMFFVENVREVVIIGASMGGTAAITIADEYNVAAVAAISPSTAYGRINALEAASTMRTPLLLVIAEDDPPFNGYANSLLAAASTTRYLEMTGSQHGTNLFAEHSDELTEQLLAFVYAQTR